MAPTLQPKAPPKPAQKTEATPSILDSVADLTQQRYEAGRFAPRDASELGALAWSWYLSGLLPEAYYPPIKTEKKPKGLPYEARWQQYWQDRGVARATIVMRFGASLGVLPEQAIRSIYIVEGQPSPSAQLMLALAISNGFLKRDDYEIESSKTACTIKLFVKSRMKAEIITAKYEDYKALHDKLVWKQYPEDMLTARAISRAMRRFFPDVFSGVYAAEERVDMRESAAREAAVERILDAANATEPEPEESAPEAPAEPAAGSVQETPAEPERDDYAQLVVQVEGMIEALSAGIAETDPRCLEILGLAENLRPGDKKRLSLAFRAKVPSARA